MELKTLAWREGAFSPKKFRNENLSLDSSFSFFRDYYILQDFLVNELKYTHVRDVKWFVRDVSSTKFTDRIFVKDSFLLFACRERQSHNRYDESPNIASIVESFESNSLPAVVCCQQKVILFITLCWKLCVKYTLRSRSDLPS